MADIETIKLTNDDNLDNFYTTMAITHEGSCKAKDVTYQVDNVLFDGSSVLDIIPRSIVDRMHIKRLTAPGP